MKKDKIVKIVLFILWLCLIFGFYFIYQKLGIPLTQYPTLITDFVANFGIWAPIIMIVLSVIRPLIFFPATLLTIASGLLFGPYLGFIVMVIGENLSANLSYIVGRYFGSSISTKINSKNKLINKFDCKFKENTFMTVLTMRLLYFPFDMVGYLSGMCKAKHLEFAVATFLGILPGIATFIFLGGGFSNPYNLFFAALFFILGFLISNYIKKNKILEKIGTKKKKKSSR